MRGKFITFEGSEGCGKSTQSRMLYLYLKKAGYKVIYLREPGGTPISEKIRKILLDHKNDSMSGRCEMLLYMAARAQLVQQVILPALKKGNIVVCDRFLDSTVAYQGYGLGMDIGLIKHVGNFSTYGIKPDLTVFLDLAVKKGLKHRQYTKDRIERRSLKYHKKVRDGYLKIRAAEPGRVKIIKVARDKFITREAVIESVKRFLKTNRRSLVKAGQKIL